MKSIETLRRLQANPHYNMPDAEAQILAQADAAGQTVRVSSVSEDVKKNRVVKGGVAVKETGKLNKHPTDPVTE